MLNISEYRIITSTNIHRVDYIRIERITLHVVGRPKRNRGVRTVQIYYITYYTKMKFWWLRHALPKKTWRLPLNAGSHPEQNLTEQVGKAEPSRRRKFAASEDANLLHHLNKNACLVAPPCSAQKNVKIATQPRVSSRAQSYRTGGLD